MDALRRAYKVDAGAEVTLEMDPGTFNYDRLQLLRDSGINRISMGVQSFDNAMLKHCGRPHSAEDTLRALDDLHRASWDNFSIDLISSLPHLTPGLWEETLAQASKCGAAHISVYDLQVEPGTAFARWYSPGLAPLPSEVASAEMYRTAVRTLRGAGFEHYEVSNYALPGRRSRHNQKYWQCAPVMAFGMSAASYLQGQRFVRPRKMQEYEKYVQDLALEPSAAPATAAKETERAIDILPDMLDVVMLALRTADGLDLARFARQYGEKNVARVLRALERYEADGLVLRIGDGSRDGGAAGAGERRVRLSDPDGLMLSNDIISSVFASLPSSAESE
jgi:oxygen-independent coproporphyrinogen-3 oxidase